MLGGLFLLILKPSGRLLVYSNSSGYSWKRQVLQGRETDSTGDSGLGRQLEPDPAGATLEDGRTHHESNPTQEKTNSE